MTTRRKTTKHSAASMLPAPGADPAYDAPILARLAALKRASVPELRVEWRKLFDTEPPNNSRPFLELRIGYRLQELHYGGLSASTIRILDALAEEVKGGSVRKARLADPRIPIAGTRLVREWNGVEHVVTVQRGGAFEYEGQTYRSLSAIARRIAGTRWNGPRFFGLRQAEGAR